MVFGIYISLIHIACTFCWNKPGVLYEEHIDVKREDYENIIIQKIISQMCGNMLL